MFLLHEDAAYIDVMERVLYNSFAAGVSLKGDRFFYQNPLKSFGNYERFEWIDTPCCPPNVVRLMASLGSYIYAQSPTATYVNLYVASTATIDGVKIVQETRYPLDGDITIRVDPPQPKIFTLALRIPGWAQNTAVPGLYDFIDFALVAARDHRERLGATPGVAARLLAHRPGMEARRSYRDASADAPTPVARQRPRERGSGARRHPARPAGLLPGVAG